MRHNLAIVLSALLLASAAPAQIADDFSGGDWKQFANTPGTMSAEAGRLHLVDGQEEPDWLTVSKVFAVDFDATPIFLVQVDEPCDRGTVKLIRQEPNDKRTAIEIDRPGLYAVDMRKQYGWTGTGRVETCLYAIGDRSEITYRYVKFAASLTAEEQAQVSEREKAGNVSLDLPPFAMVPLFNACSVYFKSPERPGLAMTFREVGGTWQPALDPPYFPEDEMYRGSLVRLAEDTAYELRIVDANGAVLEQGAFRTWRSDVPVAKTIVLDETNFDGNLVIRESGTPDGWIRYTANPGFVLRNDRSGPLLELDRAKYVILDGLTLRGGLKDAVTIRQCEQVRVINCDIAGWGRIGVQRFDLNGMYYTEAGQAINWDTAILVSRSLGTVIERCYVHDPVTTANSWYYAHPAGPQAVGIDKPQQTVLRYNDFIGSDEHRWNDAIEGAGNFHVDGGFNRDADIYGNYMAFANDDAIEIDGGQTNVRVFDNKFEGCLCGVSIQGCMSGPSYLFNNLLVNMGDERGMPGQTIKTSSNVAGPSAVSHIFNNTCWGGGSDLGLLRFLKIVARNNIFAGRSAVRGREGSPQSDVDYNLLVTGQEGEEPNGIVAPAGLVDPAAGRFEPASDSVARGKGAAIANFAPGVDGKVDLGASGDLPLRPLPVAVDTPQVTFSIADLDATRPRTVTATVGGQGFSEDYRIAQNEAFDWFTVTPANGVLKSGDVQPFTVTLHPEKMTARARYKGAFLIRFGSGYSRPVVVYADTPYVQAVKPADDGVWTQFQEAEAASGGKAYAVVEDAEASGGKAIRLEGEEGQEPAEYRFTVPRDAQYFALLRIRADEPTSSHDSVVFGLDDGPLDRAQLRVRTDWSWCMAAQNRAMSLICLQQFDLKEGEHVLKLAPREALYVDLVALTDNPAVFE